MSTSQSRVKPVLGPAERIVDLSPRTLAIVMQTRDEDVRRGTDVIGPGAGKHDMRPHQVVVATHEHVPRR
jgi:hypothetical protein